MGIHVAITPTGVLLAILIIFLLAWMITFTYLALRRTPDAVVEEHEAALIQPRVVTAPLTSDNFTKIGSIAVKPPLVHKKPANKEVILEQSVR